MIAAIYAGGLGNMIDRLRLGYVVDMIETQFMDFPVFNVADCFITWLHCPVCQSGILQQSHLEGREKENDPDL